MCAMSCDLAITLQQPFYMVLLIRFGWHSLLWNGLWQQVSLHSLPPAEAGNFWCLRLLNYSECSVQFSCSVMSDSLWPHESQHAGLPIHHQLPEFTQSIESVMPSSHLILCRPLLLLPPIPPSIRVFSSESALHMRWPLESLKSPLKLYFLRSYFIRREISNNNILASVFLFYSKHVALTVVLN